MVILGFSTLYACMRKTIDLRHCARTVVEPSIQLLAVFVEAYN